MNNNHPPTRTRPQLRVNEDWAATAVGLLLLLLVLTGVISKGVLPTSP
jgi:hypothetical protein